MNPSPSSPNAPFFVDLEVLRLTKNGIWMSDDTEITHEPTRKLFSRSLVRDGGGYSLKVGRESKRVEVEDTAYFVTQIDGTPRTGVRVRLSDETEEALDPATLSYRPGRLTCRIKKGQEEAKFLHAAYFEFLKDLEEDNHAYFLSFGKTRIELSKRSAP